ncbi:MAG: hydroxymethylpyrimidine/phosphomethylpyrimidine kinase [Proteobacteria bacterium]|nr:hydroxymethylpyrimidine/phosphomethylpyrimidine kinase [Pseudomonadota bacterium]
MLVISGFDATASAGILLDAHICHILGVKPHCVLPAFLVQNHQSVSGGIPFTENQILTQLEALNLTPKVVKLGLMQTTQAVITIAKYLQQFPDVKIIADTPIVSSSGKQLVDDIASYIAVFKQHLLPITHLLTPNTDELQLFGTTEEILATGCKNILIKGGHNTLQTCTDTLLTNTGNKTEFTLPRINFKENIRGTGCGLSTAIACYYKMESSLEEAIFKAKQFIFDGIKNSIKVDGKTRVMRFNPPSFPH